MKITPKQGIGIVLVVLGVIGAVVLTFFLVQQSKLQTISSYEDCVAAGYPIAESFPPQCFLPDGRSFTGPGEVLGGTVVSPIPITSGENAPPGSIHNLPVPTAVAAARTNLAQKLGLAESSVVILEALERDWSDACLELAKPNEVCAQVITPGYAILLLASGKEYRYRTDLSGATVRPE